MAEGKRSSPDGQPSGVRCSMKIQLSDHFTYRRLLRFALPSIMMMIFTSIYGIVDGYFVSNYAGKTPFAAVNLIMPYLIILGSLGFMIGTGGCALVGKLLGEGKKELANKVFSMLVYVAIAAGIVFMIIGMFTVRPMSVLLGADESMLDICVLYGKIVLIGLPALMLQYMFQSFFVVAEKPQLGLYVTIASGVMNMILDFVLVGLLGLGVVGAASATVASQVVGGFVPVVYFARKNTSLLRLGGAVLDARALFRALGNGTSEFVSNVAMSVVSMFYNIQLLKYAGENGVAAYGTLMYVCFIFIAVFVGYSVGTAPIVSYNYGAGNTEELKGLLKKSITILIVLSVCMLAAGELFSAPFSALFVGYDAELMALTVRAFRFFSVSFLFCAMPIYASSFFTALNNGLISATISFLRTVVFEVASVFIMPLIWGLDGIWGSLIASEVLAAIVAIFFWVTQRKKYNY